MKHFYKCIIAISSFLLIASLVARAEAVTFYLDGTNSPTTHHFSSLKSAINRISTEGLTDVVIEVSANCTETTALTTPGDVKIKIINSTAGTRYAINFTGTTTRNFAVVDGTELTVGGGEGLLIIRGTASGNKNKAYVSGSQPLFKVTTTSGEKNKSKLIIDKNVEIGFGANVIWIANGCSAVQNDGVLHSGTDAIVNITNGTFTMNGGYIVGHYYSGEAYVVPEYTSSTGQNRILNIENIENYCGDLLKDKANQNLICKYLLECYKAQMGSSTSANDENGAIGVFVYKDGLFNMTGGSICGFNSVDGVVNRMRSTMLGSPTERSYAGGGVFLEEGTFNMSGGNIFACAKTGTGALLQISSYSFDKTKSDETYDHATFTMSGGRMAYGTIRYRNAGGGAIRVESGTTMIMNGGRIDHCVCQRNTEKGDTHSGGAIRLITSKLEISGTAEIDHNYSYASVEEYGGGGISAIWEATYGVIKTKLTMSGGSIHHNYSAIRGGGIYCSDKGNTNSPGLDINLTGGSVYSNECAESGGGLYVGGSSNVIVDGIDIYNNNAVLTGGGIFVDKNPTSSYRGILTFKSGKVYGNTSKDGAGISMGQSDATIKENALLYSNVASRNGGGIYVYNGSTKIESGASIYTNSSVLGGGVYITSGDVTISGNTTKIYKNTASTNGGGIYVDGGSLEITDGTIGAATIADGNVAVNGAGLYMNGGNATMAGGNIQYNKASSNGGGLYSNLGTITFTGSLFQGNNATQNGGAIYSAGGSTTFSKGSIISNVAVNGAGVYVVDGASITFNAGTVSSNTSSGNGGGFYISRGNADINGGVIANNTAALDGGGFSADGGTINFNGTSSSGGEVKNNTARNGGGIFLSNGAIMNITGSLITDNKAVIMGGSLPSTAYHGAASSGETLQGLGGGVYLAAGADASHKTTLSFAGSKQIGLYNNTAEVGADEILACGNNTSIYIPAVADMDLSGLSGKAANWYEDYLVNDTAYGNNSLTDVVRTKGKTALRYKDALSSAAVYSANISNAETKYICIALGIQYAKLIIKKQGLKTGESAIFTLNNGTATRRLVLTGIDDSGSEVQAVLTKLETGTWTVTEETGWSWAYTAKTASQNVDFTGSTTEKTLTFVNTAKENTPKHAEAIKENKFKDKAGSISGMTNKETTW